MYMHSFQLVSVASSNNNNKNIHLCCHNVHIWNFRTMWTTHAITIDTHIQWCNSEPIRQQTHSAISMHNRYIHNISIYLFVSSNFLFPSFRSFYLIQFEYIYSYVCVCASVYLLFLVGFQATYEQTLVFITTKPHTHAQIQV